MTGRYETIILGLPTMTEAEFGEIVSTLETTISEGKGTLIRTEPWGKRKLAYTVQKFDEAYYALFFYDSPPALVHEIERRIRMNERLMKFLTVKVDWEEKVAIAAALKAARKPRPGLPPPMDDGGYDHGDLDDDGGR